ncbi:FAD-dependent oxidoreductase [Tsuneonella sp. CC-YZS046]|uniref:FAD-dependent oxidoreductase n=1 Tax=Tsuneonella sp. CC-YZS046 TaxID=3042152 RepID=UPI002D76993A|nr:FAD-dependent oxidoreductase [Tsuneonella sp. CC-YZS046]WRO66629.1 FAD-dependent oxidoreductase [Tsuneonella sp. CC-YZS046]
MSLEDARKRLAEDVRRALRWQGNDPDNWVPLRADTDQDVVVVGGGQTGVAIAYGLRRRGIHRVQVIDKAREGEVGVWTTIARMNLLRTQKTIAGPEQGNVALGFRAWYETLNGPDAFDQLLRIPRLDWAAYLDWFRETVGVKVQHETELLDVEPVSTGLKLHLNVRGEQQTLVARKLVLATGFAGSGGPNIPAFIQALPKAVWSHTVEPIDFAALKGRSVGVIGAGPSAFDAAAVTLETGAEVVHLFSRRARISYPTPPRPGTPPAGKYYQGAYDNFDRLPDAVRWEHQKLLDEGGTSTPLDSIERAVRFENFHIHLNASSLDERVEGGRLLVTVDGEDIGLDHLIAATGYRIDLSLRPELARIESDIALWGDVYRPKPGQENPVGARYPYLGEGFEFLSKQPGEAPWLADIHCYNIAASLSSGKYLSDVPSMGELARLTAGISRGLFFADSDHHFARINAKPGGEHDDSPYRSVIRSQTQTEEIRI